MEIGPPVLEKKIFRGFYHIWAWRPSWSCDQDIAINISMPLPKEAPHKISTVSEKKIFEIVDDGRTDAGSWPSYKLTFGSGELKIQQIFFLYFSYFCSKIIKLWVHVGRVPTIYILEQKTMYILYPLHTQVSLYKSGVYGGIHYIDIFSW